MEESLLVPLEGFTGVLSLARAAMGREEGGGGEFCTCVCVCVCVCVCGGWSVWSVECLWSMWSVCGVCVSIYVSMQFEGEERKKGEGHTTVTVGSSKSICVLYLQRHLAPGSLIFSI